MTVSMTDWKFLTNHALVLSWIKQHPQSMAREIALAVGVTERTTIKIVGELDQAGYIKRRRKGRRNVYRVNPDTPLRHPVEGDMSVGDLLGVIAPKKRRRVQSVIPPTEKARQTA